MGKKGLLLGLLLALALAVTHGTMLAAKTEESEAETTEQLLTDNIGTTEENTAETTETTNVITTEQNKKPEKIEMQTGKTTKKKMAQAPLKKTADGQTLLDVSAGSIVIKSTGASGGGIADETSLNPKGYRITGSTTTNNVVVEKGVTTDLTLDNVSITNNAAKKNCIDVSHANVTITLVGDNMLSCGMIGYGALVKDGMDDTELTIQCENIKEGHQCKKNDCGSLDVKGTVLHATAIGNSNVNKEKPQETGVANLIFKGGIINANAGEHICAIGAACGSGDFGGYAKNIRIEGGIITALGGEYCAGIGGSFACKVDGIYITGGTVYASGGQNSPGIGSGGGIDYAYPSGTFDISNIVISGGDTVVKAVGDKATNMPGIGCGKPDDNPNNPGVATNVVAYPNTGYQGYIQDGISETEYSFSKESPFQEKQNIKVDKYFTMVYFGPFRDENKIDPVTSEQMGANHIISKTGGNAFTEAQLKELAKTNGKDKDGNAFSVNDFLLTDNSQIEAIKEAKVKGKTGDFLLTISTANKTNVTITVSLRGNGIDAAGDSDGSAFEMIGANDIKKETGGSAFTENELKQLCDVKGKDKDGNNFELKDFKIDENELKALNEAKVKKNTGKYPLTYQTPDGESVTVEVLLTGTVEVAFDTDGGKEVPGNQKIDSGKQITRPENPKKQGYIFEGWYYINKDGKEAEWNFEDPVYENMTLKAKWKEEPKTEAASTTGTTAEEKTTKAASTVEKESTDIPDWEYSKRERSVKTGETVAKTGDQAKIPLFITVLGISLAGIVFVSRKQKK